MQTSMDARNMNESNIKALGSTSGDLSASQYNSNHRLNDSSTSGVLAMANSTGNVLKFSSEYGTYNTV